MLVFPTIKMLETLAQFETPEEAMETIGAVAVEPILPRVDTSGRSRGSCCPATRTTESARIYSPR